MEIACEHCATRMLRHASHVSGRNFCNFECRKAFHRPSVRCPNCGASFPRVPANPDKQYCSWECFKASRWRSVACFECGESFRKRISEIAKAEARGYRHMCSRACRNANTSKILGGDGTWAVGGRHGAARKRGKDWPAAKAYVLARDEYACQQCNGKERLDVHHWEPYFISFDNSPDNLVTLCRECHRVKHEEYRREGFYADLQS